MVDGEFVSLLEPPASADERGRALPPAPLLPGAGRPPGDRDLMLVSPIILYDHPEIAEQSEGALYDSTEIDEILTLRVMTMTDEEKAQARATDPLAAQIIDRCDSMSPEAMLNLHGVLRNPHGRRPVSSRLRKRSALIPEIPEGVDWWDPLADTAVQPEIDAVLVNGVRVTPRQSGSGCIRRGAPTRRTSSSRTRSRASPRCTRTVDGDQHVGVVVEDDPAADLHDWYGRYLYFAPDEVEPLDSRKEFDNGRSGLGRRGRRRGRRSSSAWSSGVAPSRMRGGT